MWQVLGEDNAMGTDIQFNRLFDVGSWCSRLLCVYSIKQTHNSPSTTEELLERKSSGSGLESREYSRRDPSRWQRGTLYQQNVGSNFADRQWSLGRYSSLADSGHGVLFCFVTPQESSVKNTNFIPKSKNKIKQQQEAEQTGLVETL
jgi:hypothetical protein